MDLTVETSCTHQSLVQDIGPVGRSEYDNSGIGIEAIHLGKKLIQSVLTLVIGRKSHVLAPRAANCVDLVDEHDARCLFLCLAEEVTHAGCTHTDEHLHEIGAGNGEERNVGFSCDCLGQQGLSCTRRPHKQGSLRNLSTQ